MRCFSSVGEDSRTGDPVTVVSGDEQVVIGTDPDELYELVWNPVAGTDAEDVQSVMDRWVGNTVGVVGFSTEPDIDGCIFFVGWTVEWTADSFWKWHVPEINLTDFWKVYENPKVELCNKNRNSPIFILRTDHRRKP